MSANLFDRLRNGDRNALARLLSLAARGELRDLPSSVPSARVVAFTGSGGVGKSTLIGKLIPLVRSQGLKVAVLACDPQSPLSGGALLGDRFRMGSAVDDGVFIRSLAALSGHGALADHLDVMIRLLESFGFDVIFLETVGAGQGDVAVRHLSDVVVLMLQPESGDDVQWEKAGILECADIVVVHKADLPSAEQTEAQVRAALDLSMGPNVAVVRVSTKANTGHAELWQAIEVLPLRRKAVSDAKQLFETSLDWLQQRFRLMEQRNDSELERAVNAWKHGDIAPADAIRAIMHVLLKQP